MFRQRGRSSHPHIIHRHSLWPENFAAVFSVSFSLFFSFWLHWISVQKKALNSNFHRLALIPGHTIGKILNSKTSQKYRDPGECEMGTTDYFSGRGLLFSFALLLKQFFIHVFQVLHLDFFLVIFILTLSSLLTSWLSTTLPALVSTPRWCLCLPLSARLTDVVRGALGSGAEGLSHHSAVIHAHLPGPDQNDRGSSLWSIPGRPQPQQGGGGHCYWILTTLGRSHFHHSSDPLHVGKPLCKVTET